MAYEGGVGRGAVDVGDARAVRHVAQVVDRAAESDKDRIPHVAFETVWVSDSHPFNHLKARDVLDGARQSVGDPEILPLVDDEGPRQIAPLPTAHEGVFHLAGGIPTTHSRWQKVGR